MRENRKKRQVNVSVRIHRLPNMIHWTIPCFLLVSFAFAQKEVGRVKLPYPSGDHTVLIEDISPDVGSKAESSAHDPEYASRWGVMFAVAISGRQQASSPATAWTSPNGPVIVDHVASVDGDGHLITFYWSPDNNDDAKRIQTAGWKSVDLTEKTKITMRIEQPASWAVKESSTLIEHVTGRAANDHLFEFTWKPGQDWTATDISQVVNQTIVGPVSAWTLETGGQTQEHLAAQASNNDLMLFHRQGGGPWQKENVTNIVGASYKIAGAPHGWRLGSDAERIAAKSLSDHLLLFSRNSGGQWTVLDITNKTNGQKIRSRVTAWFSGSQQSIAAQTPDGELVIFKEDMIEAQWSVVNVSDITLRSIADAPVHWKTMLTAGEVLHIAAPGYDKNAWVFEKKPGIQWTATNLSQSSNVSIGVPLTAWTSAVGSDALEHLAAPSHNGRLHVFTRKSSTSWTVVDVSSRSSGRVVYSASELSGVWVSRDYGISWKQCARPQPGIYATYVPDALPVVRINDVAVSQVDPDIVLAGTGRDKRRPSQAGIYRSTDGGTSWKRVHTFQYPTGPTTYQVEAATQVVFAPDDPSLVYAAGGCALARSTDAGASWETIILPETIMGDRIPGGKADNRTVWHVAVSPRLSRRDDDRMIVAAGSERSVWVSRDDGATWYLDRGTNNLPQNFAAGTGWFWAARLIALEPGNPNKVYYAHAGMANGPTYYTPDVSDGVLCNIPIIYDGNDDDRFDAGDSVLILDRSKPQYGELLKHDPKLMFNDLNSNHVLNSNESILFDRNGNGQYDDKEPVLREPAPGVGTTLETDTLVKYVRIDYGGKESLYAPRGAGEGSIWVGDLQDVTASSKTKHGKWKQLQGPPVYWGGSASGGVGVLTHAMRTGFLVFLFDKDAVHVSVGEPKGGGWYRLDGLSPSEAKSIGINTHRTFVHLDTHGIAVSPDFELSLKSSNQPYPYNLNAELKEFLGGRIWVSNDGGVYMNDDGGRLDIQSKTKQWTSPHTGLNTLYAINILGTASTAVRFKRGLYFGTGHDDDFYTLNDVKTWQSAEGACGDCDTWWGDIYQPNRVIRLHPLWGKTGSFGIYTHSGQESPDARPTSGSSTTVKHVAYPDGAVTFAVSHKTMVGYRPVIQTMPGHTPPNDGDYLIIRKVNNNDRELMRAYDNIISASNPYVKLADLPKPTGSNVCDVDVVQAAGGHQRPIYFVGDGTRLWYAETRQANVVGTWQLIVPHTNAPEARRFFVNPWDPNLVYVIDDDTIRISTDRGKSWTADTHLTQALTDNGQWPVAGARWGSDTILNDVVFDPTNGRRRFAAGQAGIFFTADGIHWFRLLDTRALPCQPSNIWFDTITNQDDPTLFVANQGRGILRIHPIPDRNPSSNPQAVLPRIPKVPWCELEPRSFLENGGFSHRTEAWLFDGPVTYKETGGEQEMAVGLGGIDQTTARLSQTFEVPESENHLVLTFSLSVSSTEHIETNDVLQVTIESEDGANLIWETTTAVERDKWIQQRIPFLILHKGRITITFIAQLDGRRPTTFYIDEVAVTAEDI